MLWTFRQRLGDFIKNPKRKKRVSVARPNLLGDRALEWAWVAAKLSYGSGLVLDFGNGGSNLALMAALRGNTVVAIDLEPVNWLFTHSSLSFQQCDVLDIGIKESSVDCIINCSVIEHVGLSGRYGIDKAETDGDLLAMRKLLSLLKEGGRMLMTVPVGRDIVYHPLHRIYGATRLPKLLDGFRVKEEIFWTKDRENKWMATDRAKALNIVTNASSPNPAESYYGLGCFVLTKPGKELS